jgi:hypothetical protein
MEIAVLVLTGALSVLTWLLYRLIVRLGDRR